MENNKSVLFIILNEVNKTKTIIKKLKEIGIDKYTVIDTMGSSNFISNFSNSTSTIVAGSMNNPRMYMDKKYNKTFFVALNSEEDALRVMDEVEKILEVDIKKTGKGIMFTVPIYTSKGIIK